MRPLAAAAAMTVLALAAPARANVHTIDYDPQFCLGETRDSDGPASLEKTTGKIKNVSSGSLKIFCPIVKKASGPGITVDALNYVDVPVTTSGGKTVECHVRSWRSNITYPDVWGNGMQNLISDAVSTTSTSKTMRMQAPYGTPQNYWAGDGGSQTWPSWYYLDMMCELPAGTSIGKYVVDEWGTDQAGYRIYPASSCAPTKNVNQILWENIWSPPGGFIRGQASAGAKPFAIDCPVPANATLDVTVGRAIGGSSFGCTLNKSVLDANQWSATIGSSEYPTQVFPFVGQIMVSTPSKVTSNRLFCANNNASGDPKLMSYRARPQPSHAGWSATAISSSGSTEQPGKALDNNGGTRWSSGAKAASGNWFILNLGSSQYFNEIVLESNGTDYARDYLISTSLDGVNYTLAAARTGQPTYSTSLITPVTARYIKIELTSGFNYWWSIYELNVYLAPI